MAFQRFLCVADHSAMSLQWQCNLTNTKKTEEANFLTLQQYFLECFLIAQNAAFPETRYRQFRGPYAEDLWSIYELLD